MQATEQFIGLADIDQITSACGFHCSDGFGVRIERLERQGFFRGDTNKEQAKGIGDGKADFLQRYGRLPLGALINPRSNNSIVGHGFNLSVSYIAAHISKKVPVPCALGPVLK